MLARPGYRARGGIGYDYNAQIRKRPQYPREHKERTLGIAKSNTRAGKPLQWHDGGRTARTLISPSASFCLLCLISLTACIGSLQAGVRDYLFSCQNGATRRKRNGIKTDCFFRGRKEKKRVWSLLHPSEAWRDWLAACKSSTGTVLMPLFLSREGGRTMNGCISTWPGVAYCCL